MITVADSVIRYTALCPCGQDAEWVQTFVRAPNTVNALIPAYAIGCDCG